jgi:hypothetical protein
MSEDEYDQLPDPFAGIDWNTVPGLTNAPLAPQSHDCGGGVTAELGHTPPQVNGVDSVSSPTQYSCEELDAALLAEIDKVERRLLQPRVTEPGGALSPITIGDAKQEVAGYSDTGSELTSRYFHGEYIL